MEANRQEMDVLIVGAGMSGLAAARELMQAGRRVVVVDKGRGIGGRMAYRRIDDAVFDHGAQFMTARSERFCEAMASWAEQGVVRPWSAGMPGLPGEHLRWRGQPHIKAVAMEMARDVEVVCDTQVTAIHVVGGRWRVVCASGAEMDCAALIVTAPIPQALALLDAGGTVVEGALRERLEAVEYTRCFTVMAVLAERSGIPEPGVMTFAEGCLTWLADNQVKGISPVPALTLQASHEFSLGRWEEDRDETARMMLAEAARWTEVQVVKYQIHGWKFSKPMGSYGEPFALIRRAGACLWLAGDAFGAGNVEAAALSGWAAAADLLRESGAV